MIRLICVDDEPLMRMYLHTRLSAERDIEVVGSVPNIARAMDYLKSTEIDVILLDYHLPGKDGTELLRGMSPWLQWTETIETIPAILFCTGFATAEFAAQARTLGAHGVVAKERLAIELVPAVRAVASGGFWFGETAVLPGLK